jgi:hypothetical protein
MKILRLLLCSIACLPIACTTAPKVSEVEMTCPVDGTKLKTIQDISGTYSGARLDLKKTGPSPQPWKLPLCPQCRLPLYKDTFTDAEKATLREIVAADDFRKETEGRSAYFVYGVILERQKARAFDIGWAFHQAAWEVEGQNEGRYAETAKRAITWFDRAAAEVAFSGTAQNDQQVAIYLPIELHRRLRNFTEAKARLDRAQSLRTSKIDWLPPALDFQAGLIAARDAAPHEIREVMAPDETGK